MVTRLLEEAMDEVHKLPTDEQDAIAMLILDELADEEEWNSAFARSQEQLRKLAAKAREDTQGGRVRKAGFDEL